MTAPSFDRIARPYRWLEYLTLGRALERTRNRFLPQLQHSRQALVLGDGDGRFLAKLFAQNPTLQADAIDLSAAMLQLLRRRCNTTRLQTHQTDARTFTPTTNYDLVITHFFLDCLTQPELDSLIQNLSPKLPAGALWLLSEFQIPQSPMRLPAKAIVRTLYLAFKILTGLRVTKLPDYVTPLTQAGFTRVAKHDSLAGLLTSQLWQKL